MLGHLLVVAAAAVCLRLGDWQWDRAHLTGSVQNWGYALQWPLFAVFFVVAWWRVLLLESRRMDEPEAGTPVFPPSPNPPSGGPLGMAGDAVDETSEEEDDDDEQLAAYNRMLAALAAQDEARERR